MTWKGNYRNTNFVRSKFGLVILSFIAIIGLGFLTPASFIFAKNDLLAFISSQDLNMLTNVERLKNNVPALELNHLLQKAAELKVNDMIAREYFSHDTPDGKSPWYFLSQAGYKYKHAGENLAINFFESSKVEKAWMNSPGHRENILKREYTQVGTAVARGMYEGQETVFIVQFFGKPVENFSTIKNSIKSKTATIPINEKKIISVKKPNVLARQTTKVNQYPYLYYAYDDGLECRVIS